MTQTYTKTGTLIRPGPVGRIVRLLLGVYLLYVVYGLLTLDLSRIGNTFPDDIGFWVGVLFAFWLFPEVVNIGWSLQRGNWPRVVILVLIVIAGVWGVIQYGNFWAPPLGWLIFIWFVYTFGHLGTAFVLSALIATPGCEMRSIPHLWTLITGKETDEHFCPGMIDNIDKWELNSRK